MEELEKTARGLILAITEKTLKSLKDKGLLKEPSELQKLCSSPDMVSLIKKLSVPKYDPCRLLRKGDRVQVKKRNGRCNGKDGEYLREAFCTVAEDETQNELVRVLHNATEYRLDPAYLELVTPVEELEPYYVSTNIDCSTCTIFKRVGEKKLVHSAYYFVHGKGCSNAILGITEAQAAAATECDRLNKEYREEMEK